MLACQIVLIKDVHAQHVPHFTIKAKVWEEVKKLGFPASVSLEAGSYFANFENIPVFKFIKNDDGTATLKFPVLSANDKLAGFDTEDLGELKFQP